ncbi:hypothetical protein C8Q76DRAFT_158483 [Earliella scabrosa]|nr:hypothetical protein C8Q76DRAFT_158483 [Earliella scabrosa]
MLPDDDTNSHSLNKDTTSRRSSDIASLRSGTILFIASELLQSTNTTPARHHDLEAFFWVLLALTYLECELDDDWDPCAAIEDEFEGEVRAGSMKLGWLMRDRPNEITAEDHAPTLTDLLHEYKAMCAESCLVRLSPDSRRLDYKMISEVLKSYLTCINDAQVALFTTARAVLPNWETKKGWSSWLTRVPTRVDIFVTKFTTTNHPFSTAFIVFSRSPETHER